MSEVRVRKEGQVTFYSKSIFPRVNYNTEIWVCHNLFFRHISTSPSSIFHILDQHALEKVTIKTLCNYLPSNQSLNKDDPDNLGKRCEMPYYEKLISVNNVTESTSRPPAMDFILIKAMGFCKSVNYTMYK